MSFVSSIARHIDRIPLPDSVTALGVRSLVGRTSRILDAVPGERDAAFAGWMAERPVAEATEAANRQHYEVPAAFFGHVLGPQRKYSCCLYDRPGLDLAQAETRALDETVAHARLADGQSILELGCGWGALSLDIAAKFPCSQITAVSNSHSQRAHITNEAVRRGLNNLSIVTCDMNVFRPGLTFDRIVSVEMFEHMTNWPELLGRARTWLAPGGRMFIHIFTHRSTPYAFDAADKSDWIAQHFFTGGVMPSHGLIRQFDHLLRVEQEWRWSGAHYEKTALDWLRNYDRNRRAIAPILEATYGAEADIWRRRWRRFFLATAGLFGYAGGAEWGVSHYLLAPG
jgi:cyclopropane-fatty-acyl-phospholipid synthase